MNITKIFLAIAVLFCFINLRTAQPNNYNFYIGDFNGDGYDDVLSQQKGALDDDNQDTAKIYFSTENGISVRNLDESFGLKGDYTSLYIGDFNGDGNDDILRQEKGYWATDSVNTAFVLLSRADGNFDQVVLPEDFGLNGEYTNLYIGDFNGDGHDDILRQEKNYWASDAVNTAHIFFSTGQGTFNQVVLAENYGVNGNFTNLYIGDFNGDGFDDIFRQEKGYWASDNVNTASLLLSNGDGIFRNIILPEDIGVNGNFTNLYVGDFNGDGFDDILRQEKGYWASDEVNTAFLLLSNGTDGFMKYVLAEEFGLNGNFTNLFIGDFNGDGKDDILRQEKDYWATDNVNTAFLLLATTPGNFNKILVPENYDLQAEKCKLYIGDFNNDGKSDIWKYWGNDQSAPYLSQGDGTLKYMGDP